MDKKISVIMGIYNCEKTLSQAIDSIIRQSYSNWELIMCDDCSNDRTCEIAEEYVKKYPEKIKLLKNDRNMRLSFSLNRCLSLATGHYVARMDGDDISHHERLEKQVEYLKTHIDVQLVGTSMQQFNETDGKLSIIFKPIRPDKYYLHRNLPFNHATILTYKYVFDALNGYTVSERTKRGQDYDLWFRFFDKGYVGENIQDVLYYVREDIQAIKRRTFKMRWEVFQTTIIGYRLLNYPKYWLGIAFFRTLIKSLTPYNIQYLYRLLQKRHSVKGKNE